MVRTTGKTGKTDGKTAVLLVRRASAQTARLVDGRITCRMDRPTTRMGTLCRYESWSQTRRVE